MKPILTLADDLAARKTTSQALVEDALMRIAIPCHQPGEGPVGLMVVGQSGEDRRLLAVGLALESALRS
jgi:Asp-tRNA(Asn)/Glu-tRNA(Gln) amidotransferase A subunit family amidase